MQNHVVPWLFCFAQLLHFTLDTMNAEAALAVTADLGSTISADSAFGLKNFRQDRLVMTVRLIHALRSLKPAEPSLFI